MSFWYPVRCALCYDEHNLRYCILDGVWLCVRCRVEREIDNNHCIGGND